MNLYSFSVLCFSFGVFLVAILCFVKRRDRLTSRFLIFSISISSWGFLFSFWINQNYSLDATLLILKISYIFVIFIPSTWIEFVFEFIEKKEPFRYFFLANYILSLILTFFVPGKLMFQGMRAFMDLKYSPIPGIAHHFHLAHFYLIVFYGLYHLLRAYFKSEGFRKEKIRYFVFGTVVGFLAGGSIYFRFYGLGIYMNQLVLLPLYPIFTGIALIRYGLFDPEQMADAFQREKMAAIGVMAASLNHEIRNPLHIAKGKVETYLDAIERGAYVDAKQKQEKAEETISVASQQLDRAVDIMQRFSDFARPAGAQKMKERVIVSEVIQDVLELVSNEFELKKIKVRTEVPDYDLRIHKRQFEEILFNLLLNSCHAIEKENGELSISAFNGKSIRIEISDSGPGIPEERQKMIFEPFYSTKGEKGTGLGLYITKQLVERNGGKISVKSKSGQGTAFILEFKK